MKPCASTRSAPTCLRNAPVSTALAEQEDELAALESIYGPEDCLVDRDEHSVQVTCPSASAEPTNVSAAQPLPSRSDMVPDCLPQLWVPSRSSHPCVAVRALLVSEYPEKQAPVAEIEAAHWCEDSIASALAQLDKLFVPGKCPRFPLPTCLSV